MAVVGLILLVFQLSGCSMTKSVPPASSNGEAGVAASSPPRNAPESFEKQAEASSASRQGLATSWGESVGSKVELVGFTREDSRSPDHVMSIYYNDPTGIEAMAGDFRAATERPFDILGGVVRVGVTDEESMRPGTIFLPSLARGGSYYVQGKNGSRYGIYLQNRSASRIEVVASVDGLDVLKGRPASLDERGYILEPGSSFVIKGFRTNLNEVAAFRLGSVSDSYAQRKYGETRNVGVIGVAVFREKGTRSLQPKSREIKTREQANPFPGQFATPPEK